MPNTIPNVIAPANPLTEDRIVLHSFNLRFADGVRDSDPNGVTLAAGTITVSGTPSVWAGSSFMRDLPAISIPDVTGWITGLANAGDPLASKAATMLAGLQTDLLWLAQLYMSAAGTCARPT